MSFLKKLLDIRDIKGPEFYKDFEAENKQLYELEELYSKVKSDKRNIIKRDITYLKIGLEGERAVSYELKNSFIPMICLHDIRIDNAGYTAQMDYILITEYFIMVLETKKLNGDVVINEAGEFIRRFKTKEGRFYKQEGMYSPISQNERHVRILDNYLKANNIIRNIPIYSAVIIANPKAIINRTKAPYVIKNGIYKYDQITSMLKKRIARCNKDAKIFEDKMIKIANFLLYKNKEVTYDFYAKYGLTEDDFAENNLEEAYEEESAAVDSVLDNSKFDVNMVKNVETEVTLETDYLEKKDEFKLIEVDYKELYELLRQYRYKKSKEEGSKPYFLFNNNTLDELVKIKPKSKDELISVQGFGAVKVEKYGNDIINIIENFIAKQGKR